MSFGISKRITKKQGTAVFLFGAAGIGLNLLLNAIVTALGLPLYLDTVGTVVVAAFGGYLPGVIVAFVTKIFESISDPSSLYYGTLNIFIAMCAAYLAGRGWLKKPSRLPGAVMIFSLIDGGLGSVITWCMDGLSLDSQALSGILYQTGFFNPAVSYILAGIIMDLPDKVITVIMAAAIIRVIPERLYSCFSFAVLHQQIKSQDKERSNFRVMSLRTKSLLVLITSITTIAASGVAISMSAHSDDIIEERTEFAQSMVTLAAEVIDGNLVDEYLEKSGNVDGYAKTKELLSQILNSSNDINYLYVYKIEEDGCHVVFDIDTETLPGEEIGTIIPFDQSFIDYVPALLKGETIDPIISDDTYGYLLTAYKPVFDSAGNCVCYVGADVELKTLKSDQRSFLMKMVSVYSGFLVFLSAFVLWLVDYNVIFPVRSITGRADSFSFMEVSQKDLDKNVKEFRSLDIRTGDELESLYHSLCRMTLNQTEQMRSIRRLSDSTAKMQDGLIITMADLVESRDSDTGAHVQKTAAYVKIIAEGLKNKGYYLEKLTPKFMSDVVRSAPLHDVGKINIPDKVLNKPGKLTDEEYEIMKTHTTAGKIIMENAISTVKGDNYLKEARNMAAYHHERWDGKGYPEGIHGEVIPLSARIMAVADVFDALTSARVYKPPFSIEKALAILEEGKGTQFDPKCVEVFMDALPEVKVILRKYNKDV